jgi:DNA-binding LacI/PurR family transcriptional regulator
MALRGSSRVAARSRERVFAAAEELGYRPNLNARRLASARTDTVGVLIYDLHNPLFAEILDGLAAAMGGRLEQLILASGFRDPAREAVAVESFLAHRVDAIVLIGTQMPSSQIHTYAQSAPTVVVGRRIRGVDSVVTDNAMGARLVTEHLISLGHRNVAHVDGGTGLGAAARRRVYIDTMRAHGLQQYINICPGEYTEEAGRSGFERLWSQSRPTAIFAANDMCAIGVLSGARAADVAIPADLSVAGFDNTALARSGFVSLTTVDWPPAQAGEIAGELLQTRLATDTAKPRVITLTPKLVARTTTSALQHEPTTLERV